MPSVAEIVVAAAQLSPVDLRALCQQIVQLEKKSRSLLLHPQGMQCRLLRLDDGEFFTLSGRSIAIEEDYGFYLRHYLATRHHPRELNLAEVYLSLKWLTGESGRHFDDYKGSFSFPFTLEILKAGCEFAYLFEVYNCRGSLYLSFRKIVAANDPRLKERRYHPPFADEFSREEINNFRTHFSGYLQGIWESICHHSHEPFLQCIASDAVLFGYCNGKTFEEQCQSDKDYEAARQRYQGQIDQEKTAQPQADPCRIAMEGQKSRDSIEIAR